MWLANCPKPKEEKEYSHLKSWVNLYGLNLAPQIIGVSPCCPCGPSWMGSGVRHVFSLLPQLSCPVKGRLQELRNKQPLFSVWARWNHPVSMRDLGPLSCRYRGPPNYHLIDLTVWNGSHECVCRWRKGFSPQLTLHNQSASLFGSARQPASF